MDIHSKNQSGNPASQAESRPCLNTDLLSFLSPPRNKLDYSIPFLLEQAGIFSCSQVQYLAEKSPSLPIDLRTAKIKDKPLVKDDSASHIFRTAVRDFFLGELQRIDLSAEFLIQPKRTDFFFDLHLLGVGDKGDIFDSPSLLFVCKAAEERIKTLDFGYQRLHLHTVMPGKIPHSEIPELKSLSTAPREDYGFAEAGIIIGLRESPLTLEMKPFWDSTAFNIGIQHMVDLGKIMLAQDCLAQAEVAGSGKTTFEKASAILNILYQNVVNYTNRHFSNEAIDGISAIYVENSGKNNFHCMLAVVSIVCEENNCREVVNLEARTKQHRIFEISLGRDPYGFIEVSVQATKSRPFYCMESWPDRIPDVI